VAPKRHGLSFIIAVNLYDSVDEGAPIGHI
jgi:hypothetical protein